VITTLRKLGVYNEKKQLKNLNTLEVGAINIQLQQYSGLDVRAIDINSQVLVAMPLSLSIYLSLFLFSCFPPLLSHPPGPRPFPSALASPP
jgi:hypothetical protein